MISTKNLIISALLAVTSLAPGLSQAQYSAYAVGSDGKGSSATMKTQAQADWEALRLCNEGYDKKDCALKFTTAIILVHNPKDDFGGYVPVQTSLEEGKAHALKLCGSSKCLIQKVTTTPGFWALAKSKNKEGIKQSYLAHGFDNFEEVRNAAIERCQKLTTFQCERTASGVIAGEQKPRETSTAQQ